MTKGKFIELAMTGGGWTRLTRNSQFPVPYIVHNLFVKHIYIFEKLFLVFWRGSRSKRPEMVFW
jgi:hypothetical protein